MSDPRPEFDAVVVGAGPNGLTAAAVLLGAGWRVLVVEAASTPGGGTRSAELTLPGFVHDVCSAIHPLAAASPAFRSLPLERHGVEWIHPDVPVAHPIDGGRAGILERSVDATARRLGPDGDAYHSLMAPLVRHGDALAHSLLSPLELPPKHPLVLARFGIHAIRSAQSLARRWSGDEASGLFAGLAAHSILPLSAAGTGGYGMFLGALAHHVGWPMAKGGSGAIAAALTSIVVERGGVIECDHRVSSLADLPPAKATVLDLTPAQVIDLGGDQVPPRYRRALQRYRYGAGVFKIDWALDGPIPWANPDVAGAATVHVGGTMAEVSQSEAAAAAGRHSDRPFVLVVQPSGFDPSRAPEGRHTGWAYCHVPAGSTLDRTDVIESQIERFAPGFRDRILARAVMNTRDFSAYNANYIGGDIAGGSGTVRQVAFRPVPSLHPWVTPIRGVYLCSASTPPGGGVHGMGGWHAARAALQRHPD